MIWALSARSLGLFALTRVRPDVPLQEPRPGESLPAHGAPTALRVGPHVHGERRHGHVQLAAGRALPRLLGGGAVRLAMAREVARRRIPLPAVAASMDTRLHTQARALQHITFTRLCTL